MIKVYWSRSKKQKLKTFNKLFEEKKRAYEKAGGKTYNKKSRDVEE